MILNYNRANFVWAAGGGTLGVNAEGARFVPPVRSVAVDDGLWWGLSTLGITFHDNPEAYICPSSMDSFVTSVTDPRGNVTTGSYDAKGNQLGEGRDGWLYAGSGNAGLRQKVFRCDGESISKRIPDLCGVVGESAVGGGILVRIS